LEATLGLGQSEETADRVLKCDICGAEAKAPSNLYNRADRFLCCHTNDNDDHDHHHHQVNVNVDGF